MYSKEIFFRPISTDVFYDRIQRGLLESKTIVVDEFHRLSEDFQDILHATKPRSKAKLILITSSLFFVEKILGPRSPLLGIVIPLRVDLIKPTNILRELSKIIEHPKLVLQLSIFAREPILLRSIKTNVTLDEFLVDLSVVLRDVVPALMGEIFMEEGREMTERYEAVIKAIAVGNNTPSKIASYITDFVGEKLSSSDVKSYLRLLERMGLIKRVKIYRRNRYLYYLSSPIIQTYYYLNEKIGYGEVDVPTDIVVEEIKKLMPYYYERFMVETLAELLGGTIEKTIKNEIDGIIQKKKKTVAVIEIKQGTVSRHEIKKFREKTKKLRIECPAIIVAENEVRAEKVLVLTPETILGFVNKKMELDKINDK